MNKKLYILHIDLVPIDVKEGTKASDETLDIDKKPLDNKICIEDNPIVSVKTDDKGFHFSIENGWCVKELVGLRNGGIEITLKEERK